jgi:hypothetical protein
MMVIRQLHPRGVMFQAVSIGGTGSDEVVAFIQERQGGVGVGSDR